MKKSFIGVALLGLVLQAHACEESLADLKAEAEHHEKVFLDAKQAYQDAETKYNDCAFGGGYCEPLKRQMRQAAVLADEPRKRYENAKEAYEKALRKQERQQVGKSKPKT
jgi:hypothetical protein